MSTMNYTMTWGSTGYREKAPGSPRESFTTQEGRAVRQLWVDWKTRNQAILDILGFSMIATSAGGTKYIKRFNPMPHADFPGYLYAESILDIEGDVPTERSAELVGASDEALLSVQYTSPIWGIEEDEVLLGISYANDSSDYPDESLLRRNCVIDFQPTGKLQTLTSFGRIMWNHTTATASIRGLPISSNATVTLHEADYTVIWKDVPLAALPMTAILACVGGTNSEAFGRHDAPGGQIPAGKAVCMFPKIGPPHRMVNGEFAYDVNYRFKVYPNGANYFYSYETAQWEPVEVKRSNGTFTALFPSVSFKTLFQAEP